MPLDARLNTYRWPDVFGHLDRHGWATLDRVLTERECAAIVDLYPSDRHFRSQVVMARHGFGRGEYKYFTYPLPEVITRLRTDLYSRMVSIANQWMERMRLDQRYPATHDAFIARCHEAGQTRPTPLLLQYGEGDFNALHRDLYGPHVFPLQAAVLLSEPQRDFTGGEFVLTEQRPRMQSRVEVVPLGLGDAVIFAVHNRPVRGARGSYRVSLRHGVSPVRSGRRHVLGIIFHDAE